jgi:hypothetical protein
MKCSKLINAFLIKSLLAPLLVPALLAPALAHAERPGEPALARYALFCIENATEYPIRYSVKWGDRDWRDYSVAAHSSFWHAWKYKIPGYLDSPTPYITFDADQTADTSWVTYPLAPLAVADQRCELGRRYQFEWMADSTRYIELRGPVGGTCPPGRMSTGRGRERGGLSR